MSLLVSQSLLWLELGPITSHSPVFHPRTLATSPMLPPRLHRRTRIYRRLTPYRTTRTGQPPSRAASVKCLGHVQLVCFASSPPSPLPTLPACAWLSRLVLDDVYNRGVWFPSYKRHVGSFVSYDAPSCSPGLPGCVAPTPVRIQGLCTGGRQQHLDHVLRNVKK